MKTTTLALVATLLLLCSCLGRTDDEPEFTGTLTAGTMELDHFPAKTVGVSGLGYYCRLVYECACPILSPGDVMRCRELAQEYDEATCQAIIQNDVTECLED